ncbi:MAG: hypothetical protein KKG98_08205 [Proteobacteria bacterium]|jgi:hypothetical protein|nr:hypothetical protein [Pseudomonadota bacterium]MCG2824870.1 hypothetical protein [Desulfobulbaceae bacterium]MDP2003599.1 hypothetical protein [Desulfurivibrionaceae bacterium]
MLHFTPRRRTLLALGLMALLILGGCATYTKQLVMRYDPITTTRFGGGDLYLINAELQPPTASGAWAIGNTKNGDGVMVDTLWSGVSPAGLVQSALQRELGQTGYAVIPAQKAPDLYSKVVEITEARVVVDQITKVPQVDAVCTISVSLTVMKNGTPVRKLRYEAKSSDLAIKERDRLAETILRNTMQDVMRQAIPDIVANLEQ